MFTIIEVTRSGQLHSISTPSAATAVRVYAKLRATGAQVRLWMSTGKGQSQQVFSQR
jgi:hypothetical protein